MLSFTRVNCYQKEGEDTVWEVGEVGVEEGEVEEEVGGDEEGGIFL